VSQYVRHPGCGETVLIHVRERFDERDSTESFLDIGDVENLCPVETPQARACRTPIR